MRDHSNHIQLTREEATQAMLDALEGAGFRKRARHRIVHLGLEDALGCVLAQDVAAKTDIPNVLTCCMDSVAVHWDDFEGLGEGELPDTSAWVRGKDWQFANTGIAMPAGFDTAIVIENVEVSDDEQHVKVLLAPSGRFAGTRKAGAMRKRGDVVVSDGTLITPDVAAAISSAGHSSVLVERKPRVAFLPTGNELVPANLPYSTSAPDFYAGFGHVFESNGMLTRGKVEQWGGVFEPFDIVPDEYDVIKETLLTAVSTADIVVINAGSSKGSDDWTVEVLDEIGEMVFHQVSHGPGHHSFGAVVKGTPVVGISGPPAGASFTLGFYLRPIMCAWLGLDTAPRTLRARLAGSFGENKFATKRAAKMKAAGEKRPPEATKPGDKFTSVRFVALSQGDDGVIEATPIDRGAANAPGAGCTAIYMLESGPDDVYPQPGEIIEVELR